MPTIRIFLAIVAINDLKRHQLDVNAAYTIFKPRMISMYLKKSIYGLN
jgi:hypothetical protein